MLKLDLSGLQSLQSAVTTMKNSIPYIFASFLHTEFQKFIQVNAANPDFPYKTGDLLNSISMSEIRQAAGLTAAEWSFLVEYALT